MKDIPKFEGLYAACTDGRIWSYGNKNPRWGNKGRYLKSYDNNKGYLHVFLYRGNKFHKWYVHRLIAGTFLPNPKDFPEVNHKNGLKNDNRLENLEWVSSKQNKRHAMALGLFKNVGQNPAKGSKHGRAILNEHKVRTIKRLYLSPGWTTPRLMQRYGVSRTCIQNILYGQGWKHVSS